MVPLRKVVEKNSWKVAAVLLCYSVCVLLVAHFSAFGSDALSSWHRAGAKPDLEAYPSRAWKIWIVGLPAAWLIYRVILSRVIGFSGDVRAPAHVAVAARVPLSGDPQALAETFRNSCYSGWALWGPVALTAVLSLLDLWPVIAVYRSVQTSPPDAWAMDWSAMAVFAATSRPTILANWCFNVGAYAQQWIAGLLCVHLTWVVVKHGLSFVSSVHCGPAPISAIEIYADVEDTDGFFGLGGARAIFNWQMTVGIVGGLMALYSRFSNTGAARRVALASLQAQDKAADWFSKQIFEHFDQFFPSLGQVILGVVWLTIVLSACLPALVKFLPILRRVRTTSSCAYVQTYLAPTSIVGCKQLINGFKQQSFWPAGDAWALILIFCNFVIGMNMLIPAFHPTFGEASFHVQVFIVSTSLVATGVVWSSFRFGLALIYPGLVKVPWAKSDGAEE